MERREALRQLDRSTNFEFDGDKVVIRDARILAAVAELELEAVEHAEYLDPAGARRVPRLAA